MAISSAKSFILYYLYFQACMQVAFGNLLGEAQSPCSEREAVLQNLKPSFARCSRSGQSYWSGAVFALLLHTVQASTPSALLVGLVWFVRDLVSLDTDPSTGSVCPQETTMLDVPQVIAAHERCNLHQWRTTLAPAQLLRLGHASVVVDMFMRSHLCA